MGKVTLAHTEARKREILQAAFNVFARRGVQAATMAEIAEAAGVSAGAIYRYFTSKEDLAAQCLSESSRQMTDDWHQQVEASDDPFAVFMFIAQSSFAELREPGTNDLTRLMLENILTATRSGDAEARTAIRDERRLIASGLCEALQAAQRAGQIPEGLDAFQLSNALLSFYMGARIALLADEEADSDAQLVEVRKLMDLARGVPV